MNNSNEQIEKLQNEIAEKQAELQKLETEKLQNEQGLTPEEQEKFLKKVAETL